MTSTNPPPRLKYGPDVVKRITDAIALGAARSHAAGWGGITLNTLNAWEKKYPAFLAAMHEAEGRGAVGWMAKIEKAANEGDWRAAAWKAEHVHPELYGRTVADTRLSGATVGKLEIEVRYADAQRHLTETAPSPSPDYPRIEEV